MKKRTKLLLCIACVMICILALATASLATEYTVNSADEFNSAYASAVDGDTIVIKSSISSVHNFGKSITYILDGDGVVWTAGAQNEAAGKSVAIVSRGGNNTFLPNASMWCNSYGLTVKDLSSTTWTISAQDGAKLIFDMDKVDGRLFYGTFLKEITFAGNVDVKNLYSTNSSGDSNYIKCSTLNIYDGVKIYANSSNKPLIDAATLNMYGGEIYGNICTGMWAGVSTTNINMFGGSIHNNYQTKPHGTYTNANDPQSVAFINATNAYIYDGLVVDNFVGMGHDKAGSGTVAGIATRSYNGYLYYNSGSIDRNILVTVDTFGEFTLGENGYTCVIDPANYNYVTDNGDGTYTYGRQYNKFTVKEFDYSVMFKKSDGFVINALMLLEDGSLLRAYDGSETPTVPSGRWANAKNSCVEVEPALTEKKVYYIAADHLPNADDFDCTTALVCGVCGTTIYEAKGGHVLVESLIYENYCANGTYICDCTNEGCTVKDITDNEYAPLFTMLGFSVTEVAMGEDERVGMTQGFYINSEAVGKYEELYDVTLSYGVVAAGAKYLEGENPLTLVEGKVTKALEDKVIMYNATNGVNSAFEIKITGIDPSNAEQTGAKLIWCGYVSDGKSIKYLDNGETHENAVLNSYEDALALSK